MRAEQIEKSESVFLLPVGTFERAKSSNSLVLLVIFVLLVILGSINLYSASSGGSTFYTHLKNMLPALVAFTFCGWILKPRHLNSYSWLLFGATLVLLLLVLIMGNIGGGARRWIV